MTDEELKELVASLAIAQRKTDEQIAETNATLKRIGIDFGNMKKNQGDVAEEFFFNSLNENAHLGSIHFDDIATNMKKHRGQIQEEYDLVMTNGEAVGIIEVKYKAHQNDLDKLERKMRNFKTLFPWFKDYKLYGALAAFHVNEVAKKEALERGFFVLQRSGEVLQTDCAENLLVL
jgi:Holliday junction resolvase-like predicted endonuclease